MAAAVHRVDDGAKDGESDQGEQATNDQQRRESSGDITPDTKLRRALLSADYPMSDRGVCSAKGQSGA